ncbi:MAG TPA: hypothetical protein VNM14_16385 [Planctomycetota bacterium]|nr:hypothetical protein [Planctomycetota bacterium]
MNPPHAPGSTTKPLLVKAVLATLALSLLSPVMLVLSAFSRGYSGLALSISAAELAMGASLACLAVAIVRGPRYDRQTLSGLAWKLSLPFIISWPVLYIGMMGYGLGGETAQSEKLGTLLITSVVLFPVVAIVGALAARRGRGPDVRA